ncbi:hypothetical protein BDV25DRAFT_150446 [Aspergillus avenaceus]|uniref:Zn(2)-C6 fungal-type domain-containing protein n=1 Tax=Aspergillus avenaceus TaxID=36643 RepID=A0A5N6U2C2_ASPAV|nr:hypothetical protein BDV25DRAFT_150446 [Aspergillus avenaceus]
MPRRSHTKSRNGCDQCKKRRVKCDEQGPPCSNCASRELRCTYLNTPTARTPVKSISRSPTSNHPRQDVNTAPSTPSTCSRKRELELMHKFSTETYQSLCNQATDYYVWQVIMPRKALEHDFLLSGILAAASLHTATGLQPPEAFSYIDTALEYYNQGLAPFRQAIDNINPHNADAVFAHSVIIIMVSIALPRLTASRGESSSMTENIICVFELLQGVKKIFSIALPWLQNKFFAANHFFFDSLTAQLHPDTEAALSRLTALNDTILADTDPDQHRIIKESIALLRRSYVRFTNYHDAASVLSWLAAVDKEFVLVLCRRQPLPLLVLMHWGVLLGELDAKTWWARDSGSVLVSETLLALRDCDMRLVDAILWPKKKLGM